LIERILYPSKTYFISMNLILLYESDFINDTTVCISGSRGEQVRFLHGAARGDRLRVGALNGNLGSGEVIARDSKSITMNVTLDAPPPQPSPLTLLIALPRPKSLRRILHCATTMGVKHIVCINSWRVEKSYWSSPVLRETNIREILCTALEQARDTVLPRVELRRLFKPFVEDELPGIVKNALALCAHPSAAQLCPRRMERTVICAVGPEGGFIQYEIDSLQRCGFTTVSLGQRILTVEQAVCAVCARLC
jgi:RsmE family RNA methyltransferase